MAKGIERKSSKIFLNEKFYLLTIFTEMEKLKVAMIGDSGVGKTCILKRRKDNTFDDDSSPTIGASFVVLTENIGNNSIDLAVWDTAGQEKFHALSPYYIRDSYAIIFVYSVDDEVSFNSIDNWYKIVINNLNSVDPYFILVANKNDLYDTDKKKVSEEEGKNKAEKLKMDFLSVSAKNNDSINSIFEDIAFSYINKSTKKESIIESDPVDLEKNQDTKSEKKSCC